MAAAAILAQVAAPATAQVLPPCCGEGTAPVAPNPVEVDPATILIGTVDRLGTRFTPDGDEPRSPVELLVTLEQAAEVPRRVNLRRYAGRRVIVICQPWRGGDAAWGCEEIGRLVATQPQRRRR